MAFASPCAGSECSECLPASDPKCQVRRPVSLGAANRAYGGGVETGWGAGSPWLRGATGRGGVGAGGHPGAGGLQVHAVETPEVTSTPLRVTADTGVDPGPGGSAASSRAAPFLGGTRAGEWQGLAESSQDKQGTACRSWVTGQALPPHSEQPGCLWGVLAGAARAAVRLPQGSIQSPGARPARPAQVELRSRRTPGAPWGQLWAAQGKGDPHSLPAGTPQCGWFTDSKVSLGAK